MIGTMQRRDFIKGLPSSVMAASVGTGCSAAAGTTARKSPPSRSSDLERGDLTVFPPSVGMTATVTNNAGTFIYNASAGVDQGSYHDPLGRFTMTNVMVKVTGCPLRVSFRSIPGWWCAIFDFGDVTDQTSRNLGAYSVAIGGQNINLPSHWKFARWRWQSAAWPLALVSIASMTAAKKIPRFDRSLGGGTPSSVVYSPMGIGPMAAAMGGTGGRDDIGWFSGWASAYLANPIAQNLTNVMGIGECCGTWPIHYRDPITGGVLNRTVPTSYNIVAGANASYGTFTFTGPPGTVIPPSRVGGPTNVGANGLFWLYNVPNIPPSGVLVWPGRTASGSVFPSGMANLQTPIPGVTVTYDPSTWVLASGLKPDAAHWPMMSYVPWLLTGDPYFLENLQDEALFYMTSSGLVSDGGPYGGGGGGGQVRAMAWLMRNFAQAAGGTPSGTLPSWLLPKATFENILTNQLPKYQALQTLPGRSTFRLWGPSGGSQDLDVNGQVCFAAGAMYAPWQEDYLNGALAITVMLGYTDWLPVLAWSIQNPIHRVNADGTTGWDNRMMATYQATFADNRTKVIYPDWPTASAAMTINWLCYTRQTQLQPITQPYNADYNGSLQAALALAWQAGVAVAQAPAQFIAALHLGKQYKYCYAVS